MDRMGKSINDVLKANAGRLAKLSPEQRHEIAVKAGKASQLAQQQKKSLKEQLTAALQLPINNRKLRKEIIADGYEPTQAGNLIRNVVQRAGKNAMMFRTLAEILGELQPQQINVNVLATMSDAELQKKIDSITIEQDLEEEP
jgi:hypothetical protein